MRHHLFILGSLLGSWSAATAWAMPVGIRVVGPDARPISNAQLEIVGFEAARSWTRHTDAAGACSLDLKPQSNPHHGDKRLGQVTVYAPGFGLAFADLKAGRNLLRLSREQTITGLVRDAEGHPIANAQVRLREIGVPLGARGEDTMFYPLLPPLSDKFSARTDAQGRYRLGAIPPARQVVVALDDPAYRYTRVNAPFASGASVPLLGLVAAPGALLRGRVLDEAGRPLPGVKVFTLIADDGQLREQAALSRFDGTYTLTSLATGRYEVQAQDPTGKRVGAALPGVAVTQGQTTSAPPLVLSEGAMVQGVVRDGTGRTQSGVSVCASGPQGRYGPTVQTDARGFYRMRLAPGRNRLYLVASPEFLRPNADLVLAPRQTRTLNFSLVRARPLVGTTVDEKGQPQGGVFLFLLFASHDYGPGTHDSPPYGTTSDNRGHWRGLGPATGRLTVASDTSWQIVGPTRFELPLKTPLRIKVRPYPSLRAPTGEPNTFGRQR